MGLGLGDALGENGGIFVLENILATYWMDVGRGVTYSSILGFLGVAALECDTVTLVLKTLGSNETLDLGGLGVWLFAFTLWLNLTTNDESTNLVTPTHQLLNPLRLPELPLPAS